MRGGRERCNCPRPSLIPYPQGLHTLGVLLLDQLIRILITSPSIGIVFKIKIRPIMTGKRKSTYRIDEYLCFRLFFFIKHCSFLTSTSTTTLN